MTATLTRTSTQPWRARIVLTLPVNYSTEPSFWPLAENPIFCGRDATFDWQYRLLVVGCSTNGASTFKEASTDAKAMSEQILAILGLPKDCLTLCKAESQFPPAMTAKPVGFTIVPGSKVRWAEGSLNRAHHPKTLLGDGPFEVASLSTQAFLDNGYHLFKLNWVTIRLPSEWPPLLPICFEGQNRPAVLSVEWFEPA